MSPTPISSSECPRKMEASDVPCAYATMAAPSKDINKLTTSATLGEYSSYLGSLHRNAYASYIRLSELEKTWGLWSFRSSTTMPYDPQPHVSLPPPPKQSAAPSAPLYRLAPAMSSIEMTMRLALDFHEINLRAIDNEQLPHCRSHRPYVQHGTRVDSLLRNITAQLQMLRTVIDLDEAEVCDSKSAYMLTSAVSNESLGRPKQWWWNGSHPKVSARSFVNRVAAQANAQFADLDYGLGIFCDSKALQLPYDAVVAPAFLRSHATENESEFDEDHFFAIVHQICEAWCCVMERQLDAAQESIDALTLSFDEDVDAKRLELISRRYRFCGHVWEFLIDHCTMLTEMDMRDYHSFRLQLHGASGGQSVRMRQLRRRIFHLLPLIPRAFSAYTLANYESTQFDPSEWMDLLNLLSHVRSSDSPEQDNAIVHHLQLVYAHHETPASHVMGVIQAVQTLENSVRRFYFGHQYMAIMVLGGGNTGSDGMTVKMLERTWKDPRRYFACEQAKTELSDVMDGLHLQRDSGAKGKLMQSLLRASKERRASAVGLTQCPLTKMAVSA